MSRQVFYGCCNTGTVNYAEVSAYLAPLAWYASQVAEAGRGGKRITREVHIITDSQYCRDTAVKTVTMVHNAVLWAAIALYKRMGLNIHWHWLEREGCKLNSYVDSLSKMARLRIKGSALEDAAAQFVGSDVDACNPM